jgi:hypothetical protein
MSDDFRFPSLSRRRFLAQGAAAGAIATLEGGRLARGNDAAPRRPKVAVVFTEFTYRSHAHVIVENFVLPYLFNGQITDPGVDVVSFYGDQFPPNDMSRDVAKDFKIPIYPTIAEALCLGGDKLAVDAVLLIGEHGNYPDNEKGQTEYPRKRFFDETVAVFERSGRVAPVFNDKHLSYRWDWAKEMVDTARKLEIPLMAGSSVPLAQRRPPLALADGAKIAEAVSIHGGEPERYGFHALEVLQSFVEFRAGGETGISSVRFLQGESLWKAADAGLWNVKLAEAAMAAELGPGQPPLKELAAKLEDEPPHGILVNYRDGLRAIALGLGRNGSRWNFACLLAGEPQPRVTRLYNGPWNNRNLFKALSHAIQTFFRAGRAPYPVERTLLVTGALDAAMDSRFQSGKSIATPQLEFGYQPIDFGALRETGASWKIITEETPEPAGVGQPEI